MHSLRFALSTIQGSFTPRAGERRTNPYYHDHLSCTRDDVLCGFDWLGVVVTWSEFRNVKQADVSKLSSVHQSY